MGSQNPILANWLPYSNIPRPIPPFMVPLDTDPFRQPYLAIFDQYAGFYHNPTTITSNIPAHIGNIPWARIYGPYNHNPLSGRDRTSPKSKFSYYPFCAIFSIQHFNPTAIYRQTPQFLLSKFQL